jgi:lipid-A-disaccharide synthase
MPLRIAMVAGEYSGDILGADLIRFLRDKHPDLVVYGIAGPKMVSAGCKAIFPTERLAVMGIIEPLKHLPDLLNIRRQLKHYILENRPDVFIGIDAPDFNLGLEVILKKAGIPTVHYVSPTLWAWRKNRIFKIKRAVDLMLTLFPFEIAIYHQYHVPVRFVGHPLADHIPLQPDKTAARQRLGLPEEAKILALLPGSRRMEIKKLGKIFIETAKWCQTHEPNLQIVVATVNERRSSQFLKLLKRLKIDFPVKIIVGESLSVMESADVTLLASGTAALEAMLLKCPMVVAYRLSPLSFFIAKHLVTLKYISLPNLLAGKQLVPEFLQAQVNPLTLGKAVLEQLRNETKRQELVQAFTSIHRDLKRNASYQAAEAILELLDKKQSVI